MRTKIIFSERCLEYGKEHFESAERVRESVKILKGKGYEFLEPEPASEKDILLIHTQDYLNRLKKGLIEDSDTPAYEKIYEYAKLAAGGAILASRIGGFSLMRPPGHHAGKSGKALGVSTKGFCYLNNIAIAVKYLDKSTLILDIDGHHGNGTEEIFFGNEKITFVSLHRHPDYPGTGLKSRDNCFNFPLKPNCGHNVYIKTLNKAFKKVDFKKIENIAVSAGFDAYSKDLASLGLTEKTYYEIGKILTKLKKHTFFVLEGGYNAKTTGPSIDQLIKGFEGL